MATIYVTQAGAGAQTGADLDNARPMSWLNANVSAGNTYLLWGTITTTINPGASGSDGSPIIIQAHPDGATLTPTGSSSAVNINGRSYVHVIGFVIDATNTTGSGVLLQSGADHILIQRNAITAGSGSCVMLQGASASAFEELDILDNTFTRGLAGVRFLGTVNGLAHLGIRIGRNRIEDQTNAGVRLTLETGLTTSTIGGIEIFLNYIRRTGYQSISVRSVWAATDDDTPPALWGPGCDIWGNDIADCGTAAVESGAIHVLGSSDVNIYRNEVHRCFTKGALIQGQRRLRVRIYENNVSGATPASGIDGNGIFADRFDTNVRVWGNTVADCPGLPGVPNSGAGLAMWMCEDVKMWCNVVMRCKAGLDAGGNAVKTIEDCEAFNNTFIDCETGFQSDNDGTGMDADSLALLNNAFLGGTTAIDARGQELDVCDYNAIWGYATAYDGQTPGANDVLADPMVNALGLPLPGSPLLTDGLDLGPLRDIRGYQGRKFIGAYGPARLFAER